MALPGDVAEAGDLSPNGPPDDPAPAATSKDRPERPRRALIALALAVLAVVPFAPALGGAFVYDDRALIETRDAIHSLARVFDLWREELFSQERGLHVHYLRPLVSTSYSLDWAAFGGNPTGFHLTNLILHAVTAVLVWTTLRRWSGRSLPAAIATLLWAWHPSKVEAVAWISGRTDLLCTLGLLVMTAGSARRLRGRGRGLALEILGLAIALTSKELAVVAPAFVAVEAWVAGGRRPLDTSVAKSVAKAAWPQLAVIVAYVGVRAVIFPLAPAAGISRWGADSLRFAIETVGEAARIVIWPWPLSMARAPIHAAASGEMIHSAARLAAGLAVLAAWTATVVTLRTRRPAVAVGLLLTAAVFFPTSNVVPTDLAFLTAERFLYAPTLGLALALTELLPSPATALPGRAAWAGTIACAAACGPLAAAHSEDFVDEARFWTHELDVNPELPPALRFACIEAQNAHRPREALGLALRGIAASRGWSTGRPYTVELTLRAVRALEERTRDRDDATLAKIDAFYATFLGAVGTARVATPELTVALDAAGDEAKLFRTVEPNLLANVRVWAARAASRAGQCPRALELARSYEGGPGEVATWTDAALVLARCGDWDRALAAASRIDARHPLAAELDRSLRWAREAERADGAGLDGAMRRARIAVIVGDRLGAFRAVLPFRDEIVGDPEGALYFARAAWAAGEDDVARATLAPRMAHADAEAQLAAWSRELGRD